MYTLVSASVLALDLVRHPAGAAVADVLDAALVLDDLDGQAAPPSAVDLGRPAARQRLLAAADRAPRLGAALRSVSLSLSSATAGATTGALELLQTTLLGRLDDLVVLLEDELCGRRALPRPVVDAAVDAAVAAWCAPLDGVDPADVTTLCAPWSALVGELPAPPPVSGAPLPLLELLEAVARADEPAWRLLQTAHDVQHAPLRWSELLHLASRAAVQHERTVDVARWQLSAVRAASASGPPATASCRAVMSLVAAVQALALRDVLPAAVVEGLVAPCRLALGLSLA